MEGRELLLYLSLKYKGEWQKIYDAIKNKETVDKDVAKREIDKSGFSNDEYITIVDTEYPEELKTISRPPFVLYLKAHNSVGGTAKGQFDIIFNKNKNSLCVLCQGNGVPIGWSDKMVYNILDNVTKYIITTDSIGIANDFRKNTFDHKLVIFSGKGIDKSIASINHVTGCNALYVSEFPNGVDGSRENFERRSLIMTSLSQSALAVGIDENSTAASGLESMAMNSKQIKFLVKNGYHYEDPSEKSNGMIKKLVNIPDKPVVVRYFAINNDIDIKALNKELTEDK